MAKWMYIGLGLLVTLAALALYSCTEADGGRCQIHSDCASGYCCKDYNNVATTNTTDGVCTPDKATCDRKYGTDGGGDTTRDDAEARSDVEADGTADETAETPDTPDVLPDTPDVLPDTPDVLPDTPDATPDATPDTTGEL